MEAANLHGLVQVEVRLPAQDVNADNAHQKFELEVKVRLRNGETLVL